MTTVQIKSLILKEFSRVRSDKRSLVMLILLPLVAIIIFGLSTGGGPQMHFNVTIITNDSLNANFAFEDILIDSFYNSSSFSSEMFSLTVEDTFNVSTFPNCLSFAKNQMLTHVIDAIVIIPENFSEEFGATNETTLQCIVDSSLSPDAAESFQTVLQVPIMFFRLNTSRLEGAILFFPYLKFNVPLGYNQIFNYMVSMIIPFALLGTTMSMTALCIVTEGPLPRMLTTPAGKRDIILSKLITYTTLMVVQSTIIFITASAFTLYCAGPLFDLFLSLILIGFAGTSIGLLISSIAKTDHQANQLYIFTFIFITLLGGIFISVDSLPLAFQIVVNCLPMAHAMPLVTDITLRGLSFFTPEVNINLLIHAGALLLISLVCIVAALVIFRFRRMEV